MRYAVLLFGLLLATTAVHAEKTDYWIEGVGKGIYQRCSGTDIELPKPYLAVQNHTLASVAWPYSREQVITLVRGLSAGEPYDKFWSGCDHQDLGGISRNRNGCGVLMCGENTLDIQWASWYWNGVEINQPSAPASQTNQSLNNTANQSANQTNQSNGTDLPVIPAQPSQWPSIAIVALLLMAVLAMALLHRAAHGKKTNRRR